jgi:hypothetical protein
VVTAWSYLAVLFAGAVHGCRVGNLALDRFICGYGYEFRGTLERKAAAVSMATACAEFLPCPALPCRAAWHRGMLLVWLADADADSHAAAEQWACSSMVGL